MMRAVVRYLLPAFVCSILLAVQLRSQEATGRIAGQVVDSTTRQPIPGVAVIVEGTSRGSLTGENGAFLIIGVPAGTQSLRARRIGYAPQLQTVTVTAGATTTVEFALTQRTAVLEGVVVTGYGTQRREAITGSVATIDADEANVGVVPNVNTMIQGRVSGVNITQNSGEPGAGAQIRIRGGTSISASNEPLYVIDGVPIQNVDTEARGIGVDGDPPLSRSPLNLLNPQDIESITILKDASSTAIYGSRGANGVILIQTKTRSAGRAPIEYDTYVAMAAPAKYLDLLNGDEYRQFVQEQVAEGNLPSTSLANLGTANTDWEREVTRTSVTHNHNLAFAGGGEDTRYRASLNFTDQQGVALSSGFKRYQGRLNAAHETFGDRLRLGLHLTTSHIINDYLPFENTGGFLGGVFMNMVTFNPTRPVSLADSAGRVVFYELGSGSQGTRNPVALARQIADEGKSTRILGNVTAELDVLPSLTASINLGVDRSDGTRRTYWPNLSPVGAAFGGLARQVNRDNSAVTFQSLLTFREQFAAVHDLEIVGGYEFNDFETGEFGSESRGFLTDAFSFNNLGGGSRLIRPASFRVDSRLVSFFTRANYGFRDRYFLTGVLRRDGSSRFGSGNKWALFPAVSASWHISAEDFMRDAPLRLSDLRLRAGYGIQGNQAVPEYASLILLETGAPAVFGEAAVTGVAPVRNPNPNLKWEETEQWNVGLDYGFLNNRFSGSAEYYLKNTRDLLLTVPVPQPALVPDRLENIGKVRNKGFEFSLDAQVVNRADLNWLAGLVFSADRNEVVDLGGRSFITTGGVSGEGMSGVVSQRILPGHPLGTFFGPVFVGVDPDGKQLFRCASAGPSDTVCVNGQSTERRSGDFAVIGNANPDFSLGLRSLVNWGKFDASFLIRSEVGRDVFNNTALVYAAKGAALSDANFLASALDDPTGINEPAIYSSRWIEDGSFVRLQNLTVGYTFDLPLFTGVPRRTRVYLSGDNLLLLTGYNGYDPEVHAESGLASRGIDYLSYPRPRTFTAGARVSF